MTHQAVIKKILIPTDLNSEIPESIPYAIALSEWTGAQIFILLTYRLIDNQEEKDFPKKVSIREFLDQEAKKKIDLIRSHFASDCMARCEFLVEIGFLIDRIRVNIRRGHELDKEVSLTSFECPVLYVPANKIAV
ncbi:MAG: hypothetical protein P8X57_11830 [Cyclobacteriaceae bacterium]